MSVPFWSISSLLLSITLRVTLHSRPCPLLNFWLFALLGSTLCDTALPLCSARPNLFSLQLHAPPLAWFRCALHSTLGFCLLAALLKVLSQELSTTQGRQLCHEHPVEINERFCYKGALQIKNQPPSNLRTFEPKALKIIKDFWIACNPWLKTFLNWRLLEVQGFHEKRLVKVLCCARVMAWSWKWPSCVNVYVVASLVPYSCRAVRITTKPHIAWLRCRLCLVMYIDIHSIRYTMFIQMHACMYEENGWSVSGTRLKVISWHALWINTRKKCTGFDATLTPTLTLTRT